MADANSSAKRRPKKAPPHIPDEIWRIAVSMLERWESFGLAPWSFYALQRHKQGPKHIQALRALLDDKNLLKTWTKLERWDSARLGALLGFMVDVRARFDERKKEKVDHAERAAAAIAAQANLLAKTLRSLERISDESGIRFSPELSNPIMLLNEAGMDLDPEQDALLNCPDLADVIDHLARIAENPINYLAFGYNQSNRRQHSSRTGPNKRIIIEHFNERWRANTHFRRVRRLPPIPSLALVDQARFLSALFDVQVTESDIGKANSKNGKLD